MTNIERVCREIWAVIVKLRDRHCLLCGASATDSHHIFGRNQGWKITFDPDYGVGLCRDCHEEKPFAPRKDNELFFEKLIPRLPEERAEKILKYKNSVKKPNPLPPPWVLIKGQLRTELKKLQETSWMDDDCTPLARGASI